MPSPKSWAFSFYAIFISMQCGCGKELPLQKWAKHGGGRPRKQCSYECTQKATNVRFYGLTLDEYYELLKEQDSRCAICKKHVDEKIRFLAVDHEHVPDFEKMKPEERRKHIRGLLCVPCNRYRMANTDLQIARNVVRYLEAHESKK